MIESLHVKFFRHVSMRGVRSSQSVLSAAFDMERARHEEEV